MTDQVQIEESIFLRAIEIPGEVERAAFLDQICGENEKLRADVAELIRANGKSGDLLDLPETPGTTAEIAERPGTVIGPYKLLQQIGEGGFGVVFEAEQERPVRRRVALKVIKPGMDTREVIARFEAERQALAMMDHPNIAKVHDAGATENGRPYFVMELVQGVPITEYCDQCNLTTGERLELFVTVCQAVQHAHQKGVIHRDIKPTNVLVAMQDGRPAPKIIDFGVAKAINQQLTDHTLVTAFAQMVGTPLYMSPEQAELSPLGVDTRSDIYSLGVLLYELLTGTTPFDNDRLQAASYDELRRIIREEEPPRPSARISTLAADLATTVAEHRRTEARRLSQQIRGELDWIVMKCLEKDRNRRYETADGLLREVERYLADEPVEARPASAAYRFRKFYRRNRLAMTAAGFIAASLVVGIAGTTWGLIRATKAEALAQNRFEESEALRQEAVAERNKAEQAAAAEQRQRQYSEAIAGFVIDDFLALTSIEGQTRFGGESSVALSKDTTLRELLDRAAEKLEHRRDLEPLIESQLCWIIGVNYRGVGDYNRAVVFLERAVELYGQELGSERENTLHAQHSLAVAYMEAGRLNEAIALLGQVRDARVRILGPDHPDTLTTLDNLAGAHRRAGKLPEAIALYEQVKEKSAIVLGPDHPHTLTAHQNLAVAYHDAARLSEAVALHEQVRDAMIRILGPEHRDTLNVLDSLAVAYRDAGKLPEAIVLFQRVLDARVKTLGSDHPHTLSTHQNLAVAYEDAGRLTEAIALFEQVSDAEVRTLGPDHPDTLQTLDNLAVAYRASGKLPEAIALFERVRDARVRMLGADHPDTLITRHNLAVAYSDTGRESEAIALLEQVRDAQVRILGPNHPDTIAVLNSLAEVYRDAGKVLEAIALHEQVCDTCVRTLGSDHRDTLTARRSLAETYRLAGKLPEAIALLEQVRDAQVRILGPDHLDTLTTLDLLATAYWSAKQLDKSIPLFESVLKQREAKLGRGHPDTLLSTVNLGVNYKDAGRIAEAIPLLEEVYRVVKQYRRFGWVAESLLEAYTKAGRSQDTDRLLTEILTEVRQRLPNDSPELSTELARLGAMLLRLQAYEKSEPLVRESLTLREKLANEAADESGAAVRPWRVASAKSLLGGALVGQAGSAGDGRAKDKLLAEAEPLLIAGWAELKAAADLAQTDPADPDALPEGSRFTLSDILDRLIELYSALDKPDEVTKWKAEKAKLAPAAAQDQNDEAVEKEDQSSKEAQR